VSLTDPVKVRQGPTDTRFFSGPGLPGTRAACPESGQSIDRNPGPGPGLEGA